MDRKDWLLLGCTLAIIVTLIACTYVLNEQLHGMTWDITKALYDLQHHIG
jgi:hypothetical protein